LFTLPFVVAMLCCRVPDASGRPGRLLVLLVAGRVTLSDRHHFVARRMSTPAHEPLAAISQQAFFFSSRLCNSRIVITT
jgi:hypothetical protein